MGLIQTVRKEDYSLIHDCVYEHDGCIVDVGCLGWHWSKEFEGKKRIIGVDPFENELIEGAELCKSLLGSFNGKSSLNSLQLNSSIVFDINTDESQEFEVINWKSLCKKYNIDKVSALKLNIEGSEYSFLNSLDSGDFEKIDQIAISFHHWKNPLWKTLTESAINLLEREGFEVKPIYERLGWYLAIKRGDKNGNLFEKNVEYTNTNSKTKTTIVTGLWDLGRGEINGWGRRDFQNYKDRFFELLKAEIPMCIWIPKNLEREVLEIRKDLPTKIYFKELEDFKTWFPFFEELQSIRKDSNWINTAPWLAESPQASLEYYNPMMMCKMFMVNDSAILDPFDSEYFYWIDGGLTSTVHQGYFTHDKVLDNLSIHSNNTNKLTFITYPYQPENEVHGFEKNKFAKFCNLANYDNFHISRGGFWGGKKELIHEINVHYYHALEHTIKSGYMGADENLFTILTYTHPKIIEPFRIEGNGLVWPFFEYLKSVTHNEIKKNVALYVIGFNFPSQFEKLCESFSLYDINFLEKPAKFLLNNSTDRGTDFEYKRLCEKYGFEEIKKDNIGICGGRQWCAEHADINGFEYHFFFEDDMFFYLGEDAYCRNGFRRKIPDLYNKVLNIAKVENFDFLKWNFSEFFGDNRKQWAWHNIPQNIREKLFPENPIKEDDDVEKAPFMSYKNIKSLDGVPYATGEIFYCNWPQVVSRQGNRKMFLDVTWAHPFEQTWMSYIYQETVKGNIKPGILLATPTEHNRFEYYRAEERREN